ncbi:Dachshund like protein 2 [Chelonia mydas]|uniref:Dachshund like protein 2 n=1 Tax=Chelonia mydas TaxID=8469 RepID=M7BDR7_CHEMY|nr:Dachshund like protein 2 [Chelonia mydas]
MLSCFADHGSHWPRFAAPGQWELLEVARAEGQDAAGLTAAAMAEAMKLQKMKLMAMNSVHGSGSQNGTESENEELNSNAAPIGLEQQTAARGSCDRPEVANP